MGVYNSECLSRSRQAAISVSQRWIRSERPLFHFKSALALFFALLCHTSGATATRDHETKKLSWCEGVYLYYAQYFQILNNEGAAKNLLFRASRTSAAALLVNIEGDKVPSHRVLFIKASRSNLKETLDSAPNQHFSEVSRCDIEVMPLVSSVIRRNLTLGGKDFVELQQAILSSTSNSLGLK
jgi:hypothetical protein